MEVRLTNLTLADIFQGH